MQSNSFVYQLQNRFTNKVNYLSVYNHNIILIQFLQFFNLSSKMKKTKSREILESIFQQDASSNYNYNPQSDIFSISSSLVLNQLNNFQQNQQIILQHKTMKSQQKKKNKKFDIQLGTELRLKNMGKNVFADKNINKENTKQNFLQNSENKISNAFMLQFKTGNSNKIQISNNYIQLARQKLDEDQYKWKMYEQKNEKITIKQQQPMLSFTTGNNKKVKVDDKFVKIGQQLMKSKSKQKPNIQQFNSFCTGNRKNIKISAQKLKRGLDFFNDEQNSNFSINNYFSNPLPIKKNKKQGKNPTKQKKMKIYKQELQTNKEKKSLVSLNNKKLQFENKKQGQQLMISYGISDQRLIMSIKLKQLSNKKIDLQNYVQKIQFIHQQINCNTSSCYFCKQKIPQKIILKSTLYQILNKKYKINLLIFNSFYSQVTFKLTKYQLYYPQLNNKNLTPSNILKQIQKKYCLQTYAKKKTFLKKLISKQINIQGIPIILIVKAIHLNKSLYFIELSDGWYSIYAVIRNQTRTVSGKPSNNNLLTNLIREKKIYVGRKLKLSGWKIHPIQNIINFLPFQTTNNLCIQIYYNSLVRLKSNCKLGPQKQYLYRPIFLCEPNGGLLEICELFILKKFDFNNCKSSCKQINNQQTMIITMAEHFYMKVADEYNRYYILKLQGSMDLFDSFKQKQLYHIYRLKLNEIGKLQINNQTRFKEIKLKQNQIDEKYRIGCQKLLFNKNDEKSEQGRYYDILIRLQRLDIEKWIAYGFYKNTRYQIQYDGKQKKYNNLVNMIGQIVLFQQVLWKDNKFTTLQISRVKKQIKYKYYKLFVQQYITNFIIPN